MNSLFSLFMLAALAVPHVVPQGGWLDDRGRPVPDTAFRKSIRGFAGMLLVTPDEDWEKKWNTPSSVVPHFNEAHEVSRGGKLFVLIFFSNPELATDGTADVSCDLEVERPNETYSVQQSNMECYRGKLPGPVSNVYLAAPVMAFVGEDKDPLGTWQVRVKLKDNRRKVVLPLSTSFELH